jgi:hypothetical protein
VVWEKQRTSTLLSPPAATFTQALAEAGGLISYGPFGPELFRRSALFVSKILQGGSTTIWTKQIISSLPEYEDQDLESLKRKIAEEWTNFVSVDLPKLVPAINAAWKVADVAALAERSNSP